MPAPLDYARPQTTKSICPLIAMLGGLGSGPAAFGLAVLVKMCYPDSKHLVDIVFAAVIGGVFAFTVYSFRTFRSTQSDRLLSGTGLVASTIYLSAVVLFMTIFQLLGDIG